MFTPPLELDIEFQQDNEMIFELLIKESTNEKLSKSNWLLYLKQSINRRVRHKLNTWLDQFMHLQAYLF